MKSINIMNDISTLSRVSVQELKKIASITRLVMLSSTINTSDPGNQKDIVVEIPTIGKILVNEDFDFEFVPTTDFKRELLGIKQDPNNFLKTELKKVFNIGED